MSPNAIHWFEIATNDIKQATEFYQTILATTLTELDYDQTKMAMFPFDQNEGIGGCLSQSPECHPGPGGTIVYLNAEGKLDAVIERIPAAGGTVVLPRTDISPHGFIALLRDSEGNIVGLHSSK